MSWNQKFRFICNYNLSVESYRLEKTDMELKKVLRCSRTVTYITLQPFLRDPLLGRRVCRPPAAVPSSEEGSAKPHGGNPPALLQVILSTLRQCGTQLKTKSADSPFVRQHSVLFRRLVWKRNFGNILKMPISL